jgi:hypothetical protein
MNNCRKTNFILLERISKSLNVKFNNAVSIIKRYNNGSMICFLRGVCLENSRPTYYGIHLT